MGALKNDQPAAELRRELAWALIYDATGDRVLADDWCDDLSADLVDWLERAGPELRAADVVAWLDTIPHGDPPWA